jgi:hypothetical protein
MALPSLPGGGAHLRGVGLRADCRRLGPARTAADGISELVDPGGQQGPSSHRYDLTGVAGHARMCGPKGARRRGVRDHCR